MDAVIVAKQLTKYYDGLCAVDHIDFKVLKGEIFGFLGPNGAGKTTTVRMLSCLTKVTDGEAWVNGFSVSREKKKVKATIGVVQDAANLYEDLTVEQNLKFVAELYGVDKRRVKEVIEEFGLPTKMKFGKLSFGFKKRACLGAAIVHDPPLLFLDEPTVGLDVHSSKAVQELIMRLNSRGKTIFLTTHNMAIAEKLCHRIAIIHKGKIVLLGRKEELRSSLERTKVVVSLKGDLRNLLRHLEHYNPKVEGDSISFFVKDIDLFFEEFHHAVRLYGLKLKSISTTVPSIEDVFLEVTK